MMQVQGTKVILTGSGPIKLKTETPDAMTSFQTQPFYHMWHWEIIVIGSLQQLLEDISAGEGYVVSAGSSSLEGEQPPVLSKGTIILTE